MPSPPFSSPRSDLDLKPDEIHIWFASLDQLVPRFQRLEQILSPDERVRAERFHFEPDMKRFVIGRGILRRILGRYIGVVPSRLRFCYGKNGKPRLTDTSGKTTINFNMSYSGGIALYAFTRSGKIGVDIEHIRDISEIDQIARQFFSASENEVINRLPESKKLDAFFNCWTRKEAFVKAIGDGLSYPLDMFDVSVDPGKPAELLGIRGDAREASRWSIQDLKPGRGFAAAFAVEGRRWQLRCWQ